MEIIETDPEIDTDSKDISSGCCNRCTNRTVHRAVYHKNLQLFKSCLYDKKKIANMNAFWGPDHGVTPLDMILQDSNLEFLEALMKPKITVQRHEQYE